MKDESASLVGRKNNGKIDYADAVDGRPEQQPADDSGGIASIG
jgi:hypothetical protein